MDFWPTPEDPEGIAWISTKDRIKHMILVDAMMINEGRINQTLLPPIKDHVYVYSLDDLDTLLGDIAALHRILYRFVDYLAKTGDPTSGAEVRQQLLNEPLVQRFLSPTDASQKNDP